MDPTTIDNVAVCLLILTGALWLSFPAYIIKALSFCFYDEKKLPSKATVRAFGAGFILLALFLLVFVYWMKK
ncbi:MAG: hypothetical protein C0404_09925 [Verrucomicrobia bacterium]|nr:hypothetical protein [Verrucomicrobiota bacterium]